MARPTGSSSQFKVTSSIAVESKKFFFLISIGFYLFFYSWIYDDHRHCIDSSMSPDCLIIFIPWHALIRFVACVSTIMTLWGVPHSPGLSLSLSYTHAPYRLSLHLHCVIVPISFLFRTARIIRLLCYSITLLVNCMKLLRLLETAYFTS